MHSAGKVTLALTLRMLHRLLLEITKSQREFQYTSQCQQISIRTHLSRKKSKKKAKFEIGKSTNMDTSKNVKVNKWQIILCFLKRIIYQVMNYSKFALSSQSSTFVAILTLVALNCELSQGWPLYIIYHFI